VTEAYSGGIFVKRALSWDRGSRRHEDSARLAVEGRLRISESGEC